MLQNLTVHNLSGRQLPPGVSRFFGLGKSFIPIPTSAKPTPFYKIFHTVKQLHRAVKVRKVVDPKGKNSFVYDKFKLRSNFDPVDKCPISSLFLQGITSELSQNGAKFNALVAARQRARRWSVGKSRNHSAPISRLENSQRRRSYLAPLKVSAKSLNDGALVKMSSCFPCGKREMISSSESTVSA